MLALAALAALVLLTAGSKAEVVMAEARPTLAGGLISFPGKQDPQLPYLQVKSTAYIYISKCSSSLGCSWIGCAG